MTAEEIGMYEKKHRITCGDANICCFESGEGEPVVLLHGNGEDSGYWREQLPVLVRMVSGACDGQPRSRRLGAWGTRTFL